MTNTESPRVDFYHLQDNSLNKLQRFCCRLVEKACGQGHRVFLCAQDESEAARLDDLLWSFSDSSFLPHCRQGDADAADSPVIIGCQPDGQAGDILVNLSGRMPDNPGDFRRIAEIIDETPDTLRQGRQRYAGYREAGLPLYYHKIEM